jgi:hypothetical protein
VDQNLYLALTKSCVEYIAHGVVGEKEVSLEFAGRFESRPVVWLATIRCLPDDYGAGRQQYIDVQGTGSSCLRVEVGLPLQAINESDVLKTIMMIRQYRNLRRGRHEFSGGYKKAD